MKNYPCWKVFVGFSLCPAVAGPMAGLLLFFHEIIILREQMEVLFLIKVSLAASLAVAVVAVVANIPPALFLALIYVFLKLKRGGGEYLFVSLAGGLGAFLWMGYLSHFNREGGYVQVILDDWLTEPFVLTFLIGALSSLLMAYWVLPSKNGCRISGG